MALARWLVIATLVALVCVATIPVRVDAKMLSGRLDTLRNFMYLAKFCFGPDGGSLVFTANNVQPIADSQNNQMIFNAYNDQSDKPFYWNSVWKSSMTCQEKVDHRYQFDTVGTEYIRNNERLSFSFKSASRAHYWYFAASDCLKDSNADMQMDLTFHFQNSGNGWYREFSYEDQDLLTLYLVYAVIWWPGILIVAYGAYLLMQRDQFTFVVKLFDAAVLLFGTALGLYLIHYSVYAANGIGVPGFMVAGDVLDMFTTLMFIGVLLLVAKGAALDEIDLDMVKWDLVITFLGYFFYIGFFIWQSVYPYLTPQSNDYKWDSPPGIALLVIRLLFWVYFVYTVIRNFFAERMLERQYFLIVFGTVFSVWFLYLPFMCAIAEAFPPYYRWKTILGISLTMQTMLFAFMSFLQWPSKLAKLFQLDVSRLTPKVSTEDALEDTLSPYGTL